MEIDSRNTHQKSELPEVPLPGIQKHSRAMPDLADGRCGFRTPDSHFQDEFGIPRTT